MDAHEARTTRVPKKNIAPARSVEMRVRVVQSFGFLCTETCIIVYWMGLWSLFQLTPLLTYPAFNVFLLLSGGIGLFVVNAFTPRFIAYTVDQSTEMMRQRLPTPINAYRISRQVTYIAR